MGIVKSENRKTWVFGPLGDFVLTQKGKKPKAITNKYSEKFCYPYINIKAFEKHIIDEYTDGTGCVFCDDGDLLMVWDGARSGYVGRGIKGALGSTLVKMEFPNIFELYAYYFLQLKYLDINKKSKGSGTPHVDPNILWNYSFALPPLLEQRRIVAKIEELFSELNKSIELLQTLQQQLKVYRQAVLKWAFEGRLTEDWRKTHIFIPQVDNNNESSVVNSYATDDRDSLKVSLGWSNVGIDKLLSPTKKGMTTGPFGTMLKKEEHRIAGVPVLGIENIGEGVFIPGNKIFVDYDKAYELKAFKVNKGDIIISRSGTVGQICCIPQEMDSAIISTNLMRISLNNNIIDSKYFVHLFQSKRIVIDQVKELCKGSTRPFLNQTILKSIVFPVPPLQEQLVIIEEIESRRTVANRLEESIEKSLQQADSLRQSILKKAFEGRLLSEQELEEVRQEHDWESASVLLERIKVARAASEPPKKSKRGSKKS